MRKNLVGGSIIATTNTPILEKKSTAGKKTGTAVYIFFAEAMTLFIL